MNNDLMNWIHSCELTVSYSEVSPTVRPAHLVLHSDLVALLPAQHGGQGGQVSARRPLQDVVAQAVGHLEGDGGEHVLHVLLQRTTSRNRNHKSQSEIHNQSAQNTTAESKSELEIRKF